MSITNEEDTEQLLKTLESQYGNNFRQTDEENLLDDNLTLEQRKRDALITSLLDDYVYNYNKKIDFIHTHREKVIECFSFIIAILLIIFVIVTIAMISRDNQNWSNIVGFITAYTSLTGLIVGIAKIMIEYVFPKDDEKYITAIVSSIQNNDLKNKRENVKVKSRNKNQT